MLPDLLSNDLCSLKPDTDRFAMVCDMRIGGKGQIRKYRLYPAAIRSRARLTYNLVRDILAGKKVQRNRRKNILELLTIYGRIICCRTDPALGGGCKPCFFAIYFLRRVTGILPKIR